MFVKKQIYIFNLKSGNSSKAELFSKETLFRPAPSIERNLNDEKKVNKYIREEDQQFGTFLFV